MASIQNKAAWFKRPHEPLAVDTSKMPKPAKGQVVIRNYALAMNPGEWHFFMHRLGTFSMTLVRLSHEIAIDCQFSTKHPEAVL